MAAPDTYLLVVEVPTERNDQSLCRIMDSKKSIPENYPCEIEQITLAIQKRLQKEGVQWDIPNYPRIHKLPFDHGEIVWFMMENKLHSGEIYGYTIQVIRENDGSMETRKKIVYKVLPEGESRRKRNGQLDSGLVDLLHDELFESRKKLMDTL